MAAIKIATHKREVTIMNMHKKNIDNDAADTVSR
jgi:hypothetical protein